MASLIMLTIFIQFLESRESDCISTCINKIINYYYNETHIVYVMNQDLKLDYPIVQVELTKKNFRKIAKYSTVDVYIISFREEGLLETMKQLSHTREFTPRALFIIISEEKLLENTFQTISKYYIYRAIILVKQDHYYMLYSYKPFINEAVIQSVYQKYTFGECKNGRLDITNTFDIAKRWRNATITVLMKTEWAPYLYTTENGLGGIEFEIFNIIKGKLGFKADFIQTNEPYWGIRINGSYTMVLHLLEQKKGDMTMGLFHTKRTEHLDFDMTFTYIQDSIHWVVPAAKILPAWKRTGLIFSLTVWLTILFSLLILTAVMYLLYRHNFLYVLYQILLEHSISYTYASNSFRMLLTVWTVGSLVFASAFKSNMMVIFMGNVFDHQIDSLEELVKSGLIISLDHDMANLFKGSADPYEKYVLENYIYCDKPREIINRTAFVGDISTSDSIKLNKYLFPRFYVKPDGVPMIYMLKDYLFPLNVHWFFVKGYPMFDQINDNLFRINGAGITYKLWNEIDYELKKALGGMDKFKLKLLNLEDVSIAFILWVMGISLSIIEFAIEMSGKWLEKAQLNYWTFNFKKLSS